MARNIPYPPEAHSLVTEMHVIAPNTTDAEKIQLYQIQDTIACYRVVPRITDKGAIFTWGIKGAL